MQRITKIDVKNKIKRKIRVAAYARVSSNLEDQLLSLESQKEHYENYIKEHPDYEYAGLYYDEGISGTKIDKRDGLLKLLTDCENGKIDRVIIKSISRLARNTLDCLEIVRNLSKLGIYLYFEKENIDTEHMSSELMLSILSSIAESESRSISDNQKWSIKNRYENGSYIIGCPSYGYMNVNGKMEIEPNEAEVVKQIFERTINGQGAYAIAKWLNENNIPSKRGTSWHENTILQLLKNEKYTGDIIFQKTFTDDAFNRHRNYGEKNMYMCKNHHTPIITHEQFEKAAEVIAQRRKAYGIEESMTKYQTRYAFSRKIICSECGHVFKRRTHYTTSGEYVAWSCIGHLNDKNACSMLFIKDSDIKQAFERMMIKLHVSQNQLLLPFVKKLKETNFKTQQDRYQLVEEQIKKLIDQQNVLINLLDSGYLEPSVYHLENSELLVELDECNKEKEQLSKYINGSMQHLIEAKKLLSFISKSSNVSYEDSLFLEYVDTIMVECRDEITFNLKCGLKIRERLE